MSSTLLYPMTVSAKVVRVATAVPSLFGKPFNRDASLEPGVHVHWALPDALTAATVLSGQGSKTLIFPAVPDLWLVIRFNAGLSSATPAAKRTWSAWVVDSMTQTFAPLSQWTPPARDTSKVHTFAGVLPDAAAVGHAGSGLWDTDPAQHPGGQAVFDPAMAAYYPEARKRFGFYDSLADLQNRNTGNVTYLVVGWYSSEKYDPLTVTSSPSALLEKWRATVAVQPAALASILPQVSATAAPVSTVPAWSAQVNLNAGHLPSPARLTTLKRNVARSGTINLTAPLLESMVKAFPAPAATTAAPANWARITAVNPHVRFAVSTLCHGSVLQVPLAGSSAQPSPLTDVTLYPNVKRALAGSAATSAAPDQQDAVELLLADVESQKYSTGGVLDMPGAAHAATFQSVPGKAKVYARMDIEPVAQNTSSSTTFSLASSASLASRRASGYWPELATRSASQVYQSRIAQFPKATVVTPPAQPAAPSDAQQSQFADQVQAAFAVALQAASANGVLLDSSLIRVQDSRSNARSTALGVTADGRGSDGAGWWVDVNDRNALKQLLVTTMGATVSMPLADNVYELPGPRWYRPWSPQIALKSVHRSYKFGFDGRFRADGNVETRLGGTTVTQLTVGKRPPVSGSDLIANPAGFSVDGIPPEVRGLAAETMLLDPESAGTIAAIVNPPSPTLVVNTAATQKIYGDSVRAVLFSRDSAFDPSKLGGISLTGHQPSPIALSIWEEPFDPLFLDSNYSHPHDTMADWKLVEGDVEMTPVDPAALSAASLPVEQLEERSMVTATLTNVLASALVTRATVDPLGNKTVVQKVDQSLTANTFLQMDLVSAPLTKLDSQLFDRNYRLRAGTLRLNHLELVDIFGFTRPWNSALPPTSGAGDPSLPYWVPLPPRFPFWSRYTYRLLSADTPGQEADSKSGPVCGLLLPDFIDHALDVFDGEGQGLGQLSTDPPIQGRTSGATLKVTYTPHPWLEPNPDPFFHVTNPSLKAFLQSVVAQQTIVPAGSVTWAETGLSAMLRTIDTIRGTFDSAQRTPDRKVSLIGQPILLMAARLSFSGAGNVDATALLGDPALLAAPPSLPSVTVRLGDVSRPDDGTLGLFVPGPAPADGRFAPVSKEAADKALVNALTITPSGGFTPATHPFVQGQESVVTVPPDQPVDVILLTDTRNGLYATCGALPRKKINLPAEFIDAAVQQLEPAFFTGPVLVSEEFAAEKMLLPPPQVAGYSAEFLYQAPGDSIYTSSEVPAAPPLSDLPKSRVMLTEGWLRMVPQKKA